MSKKAQTRTVAVVQLEVTDNQPYGEEWTAADILKRAREGALNTIRCLNRADLRVVGTPKIRMVITEEGGDE